MKQAKAKSSKAVKNEETLHDLRVSALRALKVDPFDREALKKAIGKTPVKSARSNIIALAKAKPAKQEKKAA